MFNRLFPLFPKKADTSADQPAGDDAADAAQPPPIEDLDTLDAFIEDFLNPIAADGQLDRRLEETPLIVAFHVYGILDQLSERPAEVDERLRAAILAAMRAKSPTPSPERLTQAWDRISRHAEKMTKGECSGVRDWFYNEACRLGYDLEFREPEAPVNFRDASLEQKSIERFHRYFQEANVTPPPVASNAVASGETAESETAPAATDQPASPSPAPDDQFIGVTCGDEMTQHVIDGRLANELRELAPSIVAGMEELLARDGLLNMAFDSFRTARDQQAIIVKELADDANLWFVGDIHGDLLGLECVLRHIDQSSGDTPATIVFLGDLFDDGELSYEVLLRVFQRIVQDPSRACVIAGNHDEGLVADGGVFRSSVWPSNFTDWLNDRSDDTIVRRLGELTTQLFQQAPRALFLPDGLIAAHGGVPHTDLHDSITSPEDLNSYQCLQDFVWTRLHERAKKRIPNRSTRGCELGREDFESFCDKAASVIGQPVERIIRGHDHIDRPERGAVFSRYEKNPVLTINTMCHRLAREVFGPYEHAPCAARWRGGVMPEVHRLDIPAAVIMRMYPLPIESNSAEEASE